MPLDPQAKLVLDAVNAAPPLDTATLEPAAMRALYQAMNPKTGQPAVAAVEDRTCPGPAGDIPIRVFLPDSPDDGALPGLVYFHGGGFVIGGLDTHEDICRELAAGAGCVVVSVDYRLAPEAPFPAAPDDCLAATEHIASNAASFGIDPTRLAVGGDSAGGNLATVVARRARDGGGPVLVHQLLIYPVTDYAFDTPSYRENAEGYLLTADTMRWFFGHYLTSPADGDSPDASPLRTPDLAGLPPATVLTAEFDPLRDEGEAYAQRLIEAGVKTTVARYDGMFHGFFAMPAQLDRARAATVQACDALRAAFGTSDAS